MADFHTIGIIGAGAWGTALAQAAARAGRRVLLFARDPAVVRSIRADRINPRHLTDVALEPAIDATADLADLRRGRSAAADGAGADAPERGAGTAAGPRAARDLRQGPRDGDRPSPQPGARGRAAGEPGRGPVRDRISRARSRWGCRPRPRSAAPMPRSARRSPRR